MSNKLNLIKQYYTFNYALCANMFDSISLKIIVIVTKNDHKMKEVY